LSSAAHGHVGPFPVGGPVDDHEGVVGGDALGFVPGEGVAVVDVPLVEVPDGKVPGFGVTVELRGERAVVPGTSGTFLDPCGWSTTAAGLPAGSMSTP
jgi:hypothetical protein